MSFNLTLQSAPARRGDLGSPSAWSGGGSSTPTASGTYSGAKTKTFTFTVDGGGTIGSTATMNVDWDDGDGNTGTLHVGTDHDYAAADVLYVNEGISLAFGAGTLADTSYFTLVATAANRLRYDHQIVEGTADPVDTAIQLLTFNDTDLFQTTYSGVSRRTERALLRTPTIALDYMDSDARYSMLHMEHERHEVTLAENYDETTILSYRGGSADPDDDGLLPLVGPYGTFTRSGVATYQDATTGLLRSVADGEPRFEYGPETVSSGVGTEKYECLRDGRAAHTGRAITLSLHGRTNLIPYFHPANGALTWQIQFGSPNIVWESDVRPILDPNDSHWGSAYTAGCCRVDFASNDTIECVSTASVAGSTIYTAQVWVKGRGTFTFGIYAGAGAATNQRGAATHVLSEREWVRVTVTGVTAAGDTVAKLRAQCVLGPGVLYLSAKQLEEGYAATGLIKTTGASQTRGAETLTLPAQVSPIAGTVAMWFWWSSDNSTSYYCLFDCQHATDVFRIAYDAANSQFRFWTMSTTPLVSSTYDVPKYSWTHIAATWQRDGYGTLGKYFYINGEAAGSQAATTAHVSGWGTPVHIGRDVGGSYTYPEEMRAWDVRVDERAMSAAEVADLYNRIATDEWRHIISETYGRRFWLSSVQEQWLHTSNPDKMLLTAQLSESGREASSLVVRS